MTEKRNGMAVASLVLGIIALVLCMIPILDWVLAALAIVFGGVGTRRAAQAGGTGRGMAQAGLIMGIVALVLGVLIVFWLMSTRVPGLSRI